MATQQRIVCFTGNVQGVGFRYTALRVARGFPRVTGYVRNLPDGRVELVAEGPSEAVDDLVAEVKARMSAHIRRTELRRTKPTGALRGFGIRY